MFWWMPIVSVEAWLLFKVSGWGGSGSGIKGCVGEMEWGGEGPWGVGVDVGFGEGEGI